MKSVHGYGWGRVVLLLAVAGIASGCQLFEKPDPHKGKPFRCVEAIATVKDASARPSWMDTLPEAFGFYYGRVHLPLNIDNLSLNEDKALQAVAPFLGEIFGVRVAVPGLSESMDPSQLSLANVRVYARWVDLERCALHYLIRSPKKIVDNVSKLQKAQDHFNRALAFNPQAAEDYGHQQGLATEAMALLEDVDFTYLRNNADKAFYLSIYQRFLEAFSVEEKRHTFDDLEKLVIGAEDVMLEVYQRLDFVAQGQAIVDSMRAEKQTLSSTGVTLLDLYEGRLSAVKSNLEQRLHGHKRLLVMSLNPPYSRAVFQLVVDELRRLGVSVALFPQSIRSFAKAQEQALAGGYETLYFLAVETDVFDNLATPGWIAQTRLRPKNFIDGQVFPGLTPITAEQELDNPADANWRELMREVLRLWAHSHGHR